MIQEVVNSMVSMNHIIYLIIPFLIYASVLIFVVRYSGKKRHTGDKDYFLAGRSIGVFPSFLSVVATETSVATIVAFPAIGYKYGLSFLWLPAGYIAGRYIVALYYLKKLYESENISIYSTISNSDPFSAHVLSGFYLLAKFIANGVRLFMGAFAMNQLFGGGIITWILVSSVTAGIYSLSGGLRAVVIMDQLQGLIIYATGIFFTVYLFYLIPALDLSVIAFHNFDFNYSNNANSLYMLLGGVVLSIGTHGSDQDMLQRVLGTKGFHEARRSLIYSGFGAFVVIAVYLTAGYFLSLLNPEGLDVRSPLVSFVNLVNKPVITSFLAILIFAASSSTLDSSIHSTGAVWKSLFNSDLPGRFWSFVSLVVLSFFAVFSITMYKYSPDFLSFAMGSMNYVNGGLIGVITVFTFFTEKLTGAGIVLALLTGFMVTVFSNWLVEPAVSWTIVVVLSSVSSFGVCYIYGFLKGKNEINN